MISESRQSEAMAQGLPDNGGVYLVPGFTGLGAPWWEPEARGTVVGLTRDSGPAHFVRAALEALAYQTRDLLDALAADGAPPLKTLKVDGGVTANSFAMQFVADICEVEVERPAFQEMTALGAAKLAADLGECADISAMKSSVALWAFCWTGLSAVPNGWAECWTCRPGAITESMALARFPRLAGISASMPASARFATIRTIYA